ncbi:MAG TPA: FHA domain-containing protein [Polyangiaceae bacterium]|nr:FHA domain-containing protein [Polyangiaceae bacterium]
MITCLKCGKENQDHYKFCLGCGAELPRAAAAKPFTAATPPQGVPAVAAVPAAAPPPVAPPPPAAAPAVAARPPSAAPPGASATVTCPQCGHVNGTGHRFCASCGYNLGALAGANPSAAPPAAAPVASAYPQIILTALRADGSEAGTYRLPDVAQITLGRDTGSIFAGDSYLSPRHATFTRRGTQLSVKDEDSLNGVYLKLRPNEPCLLEFGDLFRIGQEIIRLEELKGQGRSPDNVERFGSPAKGYIGRLALVIGRDTTGNAFPIPERGVHCGRERGDILFSEDGYVSGLHCSIAKGPDGKIYLTDVGSSNGTFVRLRSERTVGATDILLMGQQLFRIDC